ncbi:helix-turn-helix domain-containing protein [Patescibacteria group bacterium]|nr:helix-turn-helix domain-containing protein [Patescibacteria group bacterium]
MTPKFIKTAVRKSENLGEKLSKKRVSLGYEIKDVERAIKVRAKHLEYIENSEWDKLPPDVYVRGFLRGYAKLLKLNPDKVVMIYLKEKGLKENVSKATTDIEANKNKRQPKLVITPKRLTISSIILLGLAVFTYIGWQFSILASPPKLEVATPIDNTRVTTDKIIIEGATDAGAKVYINNFEIGVSPEGDFKESINLQDGLNLIKIKAVNRLEKETELTRTVVAEIAEIKNGDTKEEDGLTMVIEVGPGSSTVSIKADGRNISPEDDLMLPGSTQTVKAKETIILSASSGSSVRIKLNGKDLGPLSDDEKSTEKTFTKEDA